jgi:hypothetical protein
VHVKKQKPKTIKPPARCGSRDLHAQRRPAAEHEHHDPLESALGAVAQLAAPYAEEAEAIDNVIRFVRHHRHGRPAEVRLTDVLLALSILLGAIDRDLTPEEREMLAVLELSLRLPTRAGIVRLPGAPVELPLAIALRRRAMRARGCPSSTSAIPSVRFAA